MATPYDSVPYESRPYADCHPDRLATIARLFGLDAPDVEGCRVLELGCAQGNNLIPFAANFPAADVVGVDASRVQIEAGRATVKALGLENLRLEVLSIDALDASWGDFDYILCHGVYSWVPQAIQQAILAVCRDRLRQNGVAYISYNVLPGWHLRLPLRELMRYHAGTFEDPDVQIQQARAVLKFLADGVAGDDPWALNVRALHEGMASVWDSYIFHEYLEEVNEPIYFREFAERAWSAGLQYLGEAEFPTMVVGNLGEEVAGQLEIVSHDIVRTEQYMDFLRCRSFRKTLLVHQGREVRRALNWPSLKPFSFRALYRPVDEHIDLSDRSEARFEDASGVPMTVDLPLLKAALVVLHQQAPRPVPLAELVSLSRDRVGCSTDSDEEEIATNLLACLGGGFIDLHLATPAFHVTPSSRPSTTALVRWQATQGVEVTNLLHQNCFVDAFDRAILQVLDGTWSLEALAGRMASLEAELDMEWDGGRPTEDEAKIAFISAVKTRLENLALRALIV